jgi:hypothetical protein
VGGGVSGSEFVVLINGSSIPESLFWIGN